ncbi:G-rich sequence factor 1 [Labeo rohita]|uniref:G-rich sequence factor 1 n=1 Tax=Labeo rohita TaxID=84645 RepID=A0A498NW28_LABRO|nr:G-rich sequence factor 1 [Labeo rohita]
MFIHDCRIRGGVEGIHIIHNRNGRSTGKAFIELEHEEDVCKALDLHKHYLGQRFVEVYEVTNKDAEAILKATQQVTESDGVVRLKGLPFSCTEKDIIQFFSGLEIVEDGVTIVLDRKGRNSGDAFVQFATKEMAELALKKDREIIGNRLVFYQDVGDDDTISADTERPIELPVKEFYRLHLLKQTEKNNKEMIYLDRQILKSDMEIEILKHKLQEIKKTK